LISPIANMWSLLVCRCLFTSIKPLSETFTPAFSKLSSSVFALLPVATKSASVVSSCFWPLTEYLILTVSSSWSTFSNAALKIKSTPNDLYDSNTSWATSSSSLGKILTPISMIVTLVPNFAYVAANSSPINPLPNIARVSGNSSKSIRVSLEWILFFISKPSTLGTKGLAPVLIKILSP